MRKIAYLIPFLLLGCSSNNESLLKENQKLSEEVRSLSQKLRRFENAVVIPKKDFDEYLMPFTFYPMKVKVNTEAEFITCLVLRKFPENMKCDWNISQAPMSLDSEGLVRWVRNVYPSKGERKFEGSYDVTFPDGEKKGLDWQVEYKVIE